MSISSIPEKFYIETEALTFDDVLIVPMKSEVIPSETNTETILTRNISLKIPLVSAAMDTVTDANLAIAIAQQGGIGIIHKNFSIDRQAEEVKKVKRYENIVINNPITLQMNKKVKDAKNLMKEYGISGIPIVNENNELVGILTRRDLDFIDLEKDGNIPVKNVMTPRKDLITYEGEIDLKKAAEIMRENRVEKLPLVDKNNRITGLITLKDITKIIEYPFATKDKKGRLRVGAAVGTGDIEFERVEKLIENEVDVIVVDTAHGHSKKVIEMVKKIKKLYPEMEIIAGNIATGEAAEELIRAGADAVKVGIGPGSICTTRVVAGIGVPQITAIMEVYKVTRRYDTPVIADGGIKFSGDIAKAILAGADSVMIGNLFAGTTESPGESVIYKGRRYKSYRGMGSLGAMQEGSKTRYFQDDFELEKLVPEGIEGLVPYKGDLKDVIYQLIGGLKAALGYTGSKNIKEFKERGKFIKITGAGLKESHPHDILITKEAPNYMIETKED
ncbi:MAG: IMP dehydrogenase [Brevinematales bacterium]|nr:IMP dehydrogenase [Brevinematales bacterium]